MLPTTPFNSSEIAGLKQFAAEGGRIVFMGGRVEDYGDFVDVENSFLAAMGSSIVANPDDPVVRQASPHGSEPATASTDDRCDRGLVRVRLEHVPGGDTEPPWFSTGRMTFVIGAVTTVDVTGGEQRKKRPRQSQRRTATLPDVGRTEKTERATA